MRGYITVPIAGEIVSGNPLRVSAETVSIPKKLIEKDELIYRVIDAFAHIEPGCFAIAELRDTAATGELVLASVEGDVYVGRWWAKHGKQELWIADGIQPERGATILAVINLVVSPHE